MTRIEGEWRYFDDRYSIPFPWLTKPCLEWICQQNLSGKDIFEYGIGDSTIWFHCQAMNTFGVDSDKSWIEKVFMEAKGQYWWYIDAYQYVDAISKPGVQFDFILIDGLYRDECTEHALSALKPGGHLIIDNYKQPSVQSEWPITEKLIEGMDVKYFKEEGHPDWTTIVVTK